MSSICNSFGQQGLVILQLTTRSRKDMTPQPREMCRCRTEQMSFRNRRAAVTQRPAENGGAGSGFPRPTPAWGQLKTSEYKQEL